MNILAVADLCRAYGQGANFVHTLKHISFSLQKGEFAAVVDESGSDKSTLLNYVGALDTPINGRITVDGCDLFIVKEETRTVFRRRDMDFVFQSFQLISELTVEQNIMFPLLLDYQKPNSDVMEKLLEMPSLTDRRDHLPSQLSDGQQQRAAIEHALIMKPSLILADEPTGGLDTKSNQGVTDLLIRASKRYRQTILMIAHNLGLTPSVDRVLRVGDDMLSGLEGIRP